MFAHALMVDDFDVSTRPLRPRQTARPARKGPLTAHQRLVMKAMAVFAGSEIVSDTGSLGDLFSQATEIDS